MKLLKEFHIDHSKFNADVFYVYFGNATKRIRSISPLRAYFGLSEINTLYLFEDKHAFYLATKKLFLNQHWFRWGLFDGGEENKNEKDEFSDKIHFALGHSNISHSLFGARIEDFKKEDFFSADYSHTSFWFYDNREKTCLRFSKVE